MTPLEQSFMPQDILFLMLPVVKDLIERESGTRMVMEEEFQNILPHVHAAAKSNEVSTERYYSDLIFDTQGLGQHLGVKDCFANSFREVSRDTSCSNLKLAIALLECWFCQKLFSYPEILSHEYDGRSYHPVYPWSTGNATPVARRGGYSLAFVRLIRALWEEVGFSAEQMRHLTLESAHRMGRCFKCERCSSVMQKPMSWEELVSRSQQSFTPFKDNSPVLGVALPAGI